MTYFTNWPIAASGHPIYQAEHTITQEPHKLAVETFDLENKKLPLNGQYWWKKIAGRISAFVVTYNPFCPCRKSIETTISCGLDQEESNNDFDVDENVPLLRRQNPVQCPFSFTKEKGNYFFYDGTSQVRSRFIDEETLVTSLCGKPQPHIGIASCELLAITPDGIPNMAVALRQKGDYRPGLHNSFFIKPISRFFGLEDRDMLAAVGEVKKAGLMNEEKFRVPKEPIITARRVDTTIKALIGLGIFSGAVAAYKSTPGYFSLGMVGGSLFVLFEAYSSYLHKPI